MFHMAPDNEEVKQKQHSKLISQNKLGSYITRFHDTYYL